MRMLVFDFLEKMQKDAEEFGDEQLSAVIHEAHENAVNQSQDVNQQLNYLKVLDLDNEDDIKTKH